MRTRLDVPPRLWRALRDDLLSTPEVERAAVGFAGVASHDSRTRLLLRDWTAVPPDEYMVQVSQHLEISPTFWARAAKRARQSGEALVIFHSHPRGSQPSFSGSDDAGEHMLIPKIQARAPVPVGAVVVSPVGERGRVTEVDQPARDLRVQLVGDQFKVGGNRPTDDRFDRQVRALTRDGQAALSSLSVGVVGAGGLGSHVIQQLVHLGIGEVIAIDPDHVARSNLSRLVGATRFDALLHRAKTHVARRLARRVGGPTKVTEVRRSITEEWAARRLLSCDVIIGCTDNQWSRTVLNAIAFQYYVPVIDLGVELQQRGAIGGRVAWLGPGAACLWCLNILNAERVRIEQLPKGTADAERARGYIEGVDEPAPAVVSMNGVVASLAVTELLARITGFAGSDPRPNLLLYRAADGVVRRTSPPAKNGCLTCSTSGQLGAGDLAGPPWHS
jgi:molybdopterin/thiamine biosynthesis adenylyltransferase